MAREALKPNRARGTRLKQLREDVEYADVKSAANGAGVSAGGILKWESGEPLERKSLQALARYYGANPRWIETGEGEMLRPGDYFLERLTALEAAAKERPSAEDLTTFRHALASLATLVLEPDLDPSARLLLEHELSVVRQWSTSDPTTEAPASEEANQ